MNLDILVHESEAKTALLKGVQNMFNNNAHELAELETEMQVLREGEAAFNTLVRALYEAYTNKQDITPHLRTLFDASIGRVI